MNWKDYIGPILTILGLMVAGLGSYFAQGTQISLLEQKQAGIIAKAIEDRQDHRGEIGLLRAQIDLMNLREREANTQRARIETRQEQILQSVARIEGQRP